jgi:hypothetical protein
MSLIDALPQDKMKPCLIGRNGNAFVVQLWNGSTFCIGDDEADVSAIDFLNEVINVPGNRIEDIEGLSTALDAIVSDIEGKAETIHTHNVLDVDGLDDVLDELQQSIDNIQLTPGPQGATGPKGDKGG